MMRVKVVANNNYACSNDDCNFLTWSHDDEDGSSDDGMVMLMSKLVVFSLLINCKAM